MNRIPTAGENDVLPIERRVAERRSPPTGLAAMLDAYQNDERPFPSYADLRGLCATPPASPAATNQQKLTTQGMADCMDMVRTDLIEMGIIDSTVAPMFIPEAIARYIKNLASPAAPADLVAVRDGEITLHQWPRTAMRNLVVVLTNTADARRRALDAEDMTLVLNRMAELRRALVESGAVTAAPASAPRKLARYGLSARSSTIQPQENGPYYLASDVDAAAPQLEVPQGDWKLVRAKVSNAMIDAFNDVPVGICGSPPHVQHVWDAMLAAAPAAQPAAPGDIETTGLARAFEIAQDVIDECDRNAECEEESGARRVRDAIQKEMHAATQGAGNSSEGVKS